MATRTKLAVILHADVVDSTRLVQLDEQVAHERMRAAFRRLSELISAGGGTTHEIRGDALVAEFDRASDAAETALEFQDRNVDHIETLDGEIRPELRVGIALGEVIVADGTVTGAGVVLAQRLEQLADPGGVVISAAIREAVPARLLFRYDDLGARELKGFDLAQHAYALRRDTTDPAPPRKASAESIDSPAERASIAVLPFANHSDDVAQEYFADGITEDLISALSRFRWLRVAARNSAFFYKSRQLDPDEAARELGVRYLLEGSVRRSGSRVRVTAQLSDTLQRAQLWSERFDREFEDVFELQDEITLAIATMLEPELIASESAIAKRSRPEDMRAWDFYLQGMAQFWNGTAAQNRAARGLFERALEIEPEMSMALSALGWTYILDALIGFSDAPETSRRKALELGRRAAAVAPRDSIAHYIHGRALAINGEPDAGIVELERAIELNPSSAFAHFGLGHTLVWADRPDEGLPHLQRVVKLSPHDPTLWAAYNTMAIAHALAGRLQEAVECGLESTRIAPDQWAPMARLAVVLSQLGKTEAASEALAKAIAANPRLSLDWVREHVHSPESRAGRHLIDGLRALGLRAQV